jgi:putative restriction endonuclease
VISDELDVLLRSAAFSYLRRLTAISGGIVTRAELEAFEFQGQRVPLVSRQQGIRKVAGLDAALSILTTYAPRPDMRPYDDGEGPDGYPRYKWRGTNPEAFDNIALRRSMLDKKPLAWFWGIAPGVFEPIFPVWMVGEEPDQNQFVVAIDEAMREQWTDLVSHPVDIAARRQYAQVIVRQRLHQKVFRARVLIAYQSACAMCHLRHQELLDAAHIKEDSEGGEPIVPNGVAMCAIHHRAFDSNILGIRPDYIVEVRSDVLSERDGPTLQHALQGLHRTLLSVPRQRHAQPDRTLLEERFERFRQAG